MIAPKDIEVVNELNQRGLHKTQAYSELGFEELVSINKRVDEWLQQQSFWDIAPQPHYSKLTISGSSEDKGFEGKEIPDRVEWDLRFADQLPDSIRGGYIQTGLNHGLLHEKRARPRRELNSAPSIFSTSNYFQTKIGNNERGWVAKGTLPRNAWIGSKTIEVEPEGPFDLGIRSEQIPVYTDLERDAREGFRAAFEWAKFRTMAVACTQYATEMLRQEWSSLPKRKNHQENYNIRELMRFRSEETLPVIIGFLPDTENHQGPTALKPDYLPGVLETTVALELEKGMNSRMHGRKTHETPIYNIAPSPIEISPRINGYDATIPFRANIFGTADSEVRDQIQSELRKYFDVTVGEKPTDIYVRLHIPQADQVRTAILTGERKTELHKQTAALTESLNHVSNVMGLWDKQLATMEAGYKGMVTSGRQHHLRGLEQPLMMSTGNRSYTSTK